MKWINFQMPTKEAQVKGMVAIGHAEVAGAVTKVPLFWRAIAKAECKEEFWDIWGKENEETIKKFHILRVLLIGFTSEEQMEYDERVVTDIMTELGGIPRPTKPSDESWLKNADSAGMWLMMRLLYVGRLHHRVHVPGDGPRRELRGGEEGITRRR